MSTKNIDDTWRIKGNDQLNNLVRSNIIDCIKAQRLSWFGHVHRMTNKMMVKLCKWKLISERLAGRTNIRWGGNMKDLRLYICIPSNCTQLIYFINNTLKHMYCLKL